MTPQPVPAPKLGPMARRIAATRPQPVEKWQPAWLRNRPAPKDLSGALS